MITQVITYEIDVAYSHDGDDLPNISMLTQRRLKEHLENAIEHMRQEDSLGTAEISANWITVK